MAPHHHHFFNSTSLHDQETDSAGIHTLLEEPLNPFTRAKMSRLRPLRGACNCGRNHYSIVVPEGATEEAQVYFDDSSESRRSQATLMAAWLRVPLTWYSSATSAFFPNETHASIRRTFTPLHLPHCQRIFCGYCGTHLSLWTEQPPSEAEYMHITLGSLLSEDIHALQELELLPEDVEAGDLQPSSSEQAVQEAPAGEQEVGQPSTRTERSGRTGGLAWFEELLHGSRLGRTRNTRRGMGLSVDGSTRVEWEVSEYFEDENGEVGMEPEPEPVPTPTSSKRKIDDVAEGDDVSMQQ